jgi:hypothetical protein
MVRIPIIALPFVPRTLIDGRDKPRNVGSASGSRSP